MEDRRLELLWQPLEEGARLYRVYGPSLCVEIPERVGGLPITEIGAYCFSASERYPKEGCFLTRIGDKEERIEEATMPSVSGKYVEEVSLPDTVKIIHNAAFYNCRVLRSLSVGKELEGIGSDAVMNCTRLHKVVMRCDCQEMNGLSLILEQLLTDVEVSFYPKKGNCQSVLLFPEYYEWLDEVGPAHLFTRSIVGGGFRMRQSFQDRKVSYSKYDESFRHIYKTESDATICRMAYYRLRWPVNLSKEMEELYGQEIEKRYTSLMKPLVQDRDMEAIQFLCTYFSPEQDVLTTWMQQCIDSDWGEGSAFFMEEKHKKGSFAKKSFDFDDFEDDW